MISGMRYCPRGTNLDASRAKDATAKIEQNRLAGQALDGVRWTYRYARVASFRAFCGIHIQRAAMTVRQGRGGAVRIGHRFTTALKPMGDSINDEHGFEAAS
jgi:hypothetical protein